MKVKYYMIKNLVFDLGQVIFSFKRQYMVERYVSDEEDSVLLQSVVFDRMYWDKVDSGTLTDEEALSHMLPRLPKRLHTVAEKIYCNWIYNIPEIEGMTDLIREMKKRFGIRAFVLSNMVKRFVDHSYEMPFLTEFEKCIFSSVCGLTKPNIEIFEYLCRECAIAPEETLFIDDRQINVDAAEAFGIKGYRFTGKAEPLREYLIDLLSNQ